jgi:hypothetical protein
VPVPSSFDYAVVRVVPRVERGEFINAGVIVFCLEHRYLEARVQVDEARLKALWPEIDVELVRKHLFRQDRLRGLASESGFTGWCRREARLFKCRRCIPGCAKSPG